MQYSNTTAARHWMTAMALALGAAGASAQTLPTSPNVVSGQASFSRAGNVYSVTNTPGAIIQWQSFSIGAGATTRFLQQSASSAVLNRIVGQDPSQILGTLQSNGRVFLINPNGVLFGAGSRVDVNGLVASSLALTNQDFLAGKMNFTAGSTAGAVNNAGAITTPGGGSVYLLAPSVGNSGVIQSPGGEVVLAAGRSVQLVDSASPNLHVVVSAPEDQAVNLGQILAQGGKVGIYGGLINQRGQVNADSAVVGANGQIVFKASSDLQLGAGSVTSASGDSGGGTVDITAARQLTMDPDAVIRADATHAGDGGKVKLISDGLARVYGSISARGGDTSGNGGFVEVSGRQLDMQGHVDTRAPHGRMGNLLLDPTNIFIANDQTSATAAGMSGNDVTTSGFQATNAVGDSLLSVGTLQTALGTSIVTISTDNAVGTGAGFIRVVDPVTWVGDTSLTLLATSGIQVNASITGSLGGTLALRTTSGNISQTAPIIVPRLLAHADAGAVNLTNAGNQVGELAGYAGGTGGFNFTNNASPLMISAIGDGPVFDAGITSLGSGPININAGGDLTAMSNVTSAAGNIAISAAGALDTAQATVATTSGRITIQGTVIQYSLADCTANPALAGCSAVLPTLAACTANPALAGCSAVLPPEPVLPTVGECTANPALAGCDSVLPSLSSCTTNPALAGCSVVLPSISTCTANPAAAGCSAVLPTLASCTTTPAQAGCSVVLPTLTSCVANPALAGCSVVLPTVAACTANPTQAGCIVVLPSLSACTADPVLAGCSVVLPTLATCTASPTQAGCSVVLPTLATCISSPALGGCSAVLPTLAVCASTPSTAGCSVVLPSLAACTSTPTMAGCSVVLPTLSACISTPTAAGCSAVLPSLAACTATPTIGGCSVVLPTLTACTSTPTAAGCSAVLPPVDICISNPAVAACQVVLPPQGNTSTSINQAINTTINVINVSTTIVKLVSAPLATASNLTAGGSAPAAPSTRTDATTSDKSDDKVADKNSDKIDTAGVVAKNDPTKKMYCN